MIEDLGIYDSCSMYHRNGRDPISKPSCHFDGYWWVQPAPGTGTLEIETPKGKVYVERGWQCRECKTLFFGSEMDDLRHACTGDPDHRPLIAKWTAAAIAMVALLFYVWS